MAINPFSIRQLPGTILQQASVSGPSSWSFETHFVEVPDGARTFFTLAVSYVPAKILVWSDGVKQTQTGSSPQIVQHPPNVVEFITPPLTGAILECLYLIPNATELSNWVLDEAPAGSKNGSNQLFTTTFNYVSGHILFFRNGYKGQKGIGKDYVEVNQNTIQITPAPQSTDDIELTYYILV